MITFNANVDSFNIYWVDIYTNFAKKLLQFKNSRNQLIEIIKEVYEEIDIKLPTLERDNNIVDIDPFTVFGLFNKSSLTNNNRVKILLALSKRLGMNIDTISFEGVPTVNNQNATFYYFVGDRNADDIDNLWGLFDAALKYIDDKSETVRNEFCHYFNLVISAKGNNNSKITMGLFWVSARDYLNLDSRNQWFIYETDKLPTALVEKLPKVTNKIAAETYLTILESVRTYLNSADSIHNSFVDLSYNAWIYSNEVNEQIKAEKQDVTTVNSLGDNEESETHYWLYAPGHNAEKWGEFYSEKIMAIGWGQIGDLNDFPDKAAIKAKLKEVFGNEYSYRNDAHALWQFANEIKIGDVIFVKQGTGKIVGRGIVESDYEYDEKADDYNHVRKVRWINNGCWEHPGKAALKTLTDITNYKEYVQKINALFDDEDSDLIEEQEKPFDKYTEQDFLNEVFMSADDYDILKNLILNKKNIILQGAPGVGKTFAAKRLAYSIMGEKDTNRVVMVQFHQSYSYEDFIMGYRPTSDGHFELKKGPFYNFCKRAEDDGDNKYFFIIDEINRGNISKIFGELFMLMENDKRNLKLPLMYGEEEFSIPENVYVIGMMNTADRSLAMLDYALRRRFAFYEFKPAFDTEGFRKYRDDKANEKYNRLISAIEKINETIENDVTLGKGFRIGHSYFCTKNTVDDKWLNSVVTYEILPLLEEYWFDDNSKVVECERILKEAIK